MARLLHIAVLVLWSAVVLALGIGDALADRRIALVIGNSKYKSDSLVLTNPGTDAEDMAAVLRKLDFEVILKRDATTREMDLALKQFGDAAATADTVMFFYAGHALQFQGNNFLMPIDAILEEEVDLRRSMVSDEQIRSALDRSSGVKVMILDACRNNPYADRFKRNVLGMTRAIESTRGLARIDKTQGTVVAYAAAPGDVALDGNNSGRNSPFTAALVRWLQEPAIEISTMFRRVTNDVWDQTKGRQQPEYTSTLRNDYFLDPLADKTIWDRIRESNDTSAIRDFIRQFPNSVRVLDAQNRLRIIVDGQRQREEQANKDRQQADADRARQEVCRREGDEFTKLRDDLAGLQTSVRRWSCPQVVADANAQINSIVALREAAAKADEARRAEEQKRLAAERCRNEQAQVEALGNDLAKLQEFAKQPICDAARTFANDRIKTVVAQRQAEERRLAETERACRAEQQTLTAIWNDLPKLQAFRASCEQVRATAGERIKTVAAEQREREEALARQQASAREQAAREKLEREQAAVREQALREQTARERAAREQAAREQAAREQAAREQAAREQAEREQAAAREQAARVCASEQAEMASSLNDLDKLQDLQRRSTCTETKPSLNARIAELDAAHKQELERQQQAAFKLAALEEEQNELRRKEELRLRTDKEREQALLKCTAENAELGTIETDLAKLQEFSKRIGCDEVRAITKAKINNLVREESECKDQDKNRNFIRDQVRASSKRGNLSEYLQKAVKFEQVMSCARLRPSVQEMIGTIRVKIAQIDLKSLACYTGVADGALNDATRDAVKLFLTKIARPDKDGEVDEDLLTRLSDRSNASVCKPEPQEPAVVHRPPQREEQRRPVAAPRREPPRERQAAPQPQRQAPPPRPAAQAVARPAAPAPSGGLVGVH
jgi:Caspase domain